MVEYHTFNVRVPSSSLGRLTFIKYNRDAKKNYDLLSLKDKSILFLEAIRNGITNIEAIKEAYNKRYYNDGGSIYTVLKHDNLSKISKNLGISLLDLIAANPLIKDFNLINENDVLNLPKTSQNILHINSDRRPLETNPYSRQFADTVYMMKDSDFNRINGTNISSTNPEGTVLIGKNKDGLTVIGSHFALPTAEVSIMSPKKLRQLVLESYTNDDAEVALNNYIAVNGHNIPKDILELIENFLLKSKILPMYHSNPDLKNSASGKAYFNKDADVLRDINKLENNILKAEAIAARAGLSWVTRGFSEFALPTTPLILNMLGFEESAKKVADIYQATSVGSYIENPYLANIANTLLAMVGSKIMASNLMPTLGLEVAATAADLNNHDTLARLLRAGLGAYYLRNLSPSRQWEYLKLNYVDFARNPSIANLGKTKILRDAKTHALVLTNWGVIEGLHNLAEHGLLTEELLQLLEIASGRFISKMTPLDNAATLAAGVTGGRPTADYSLLAKDIFKQVIPLTAKRAAISAKNTMHNIKQFLTNGYDYEDTRFLPWTYSLIALINKAGRRNGEDRSTGKNPNGNNFLEAVAPLYVRMKNLLTGEYYLEKLDNNHTSYNVISALMGKLRKTRIGDKLLGGELIERTANGDYLIEMDATTSIAKTDAFFDQDIPRDSKEVLSIPLPRIDNALSLGKFFKGKKLYDAGYNAGGGFLKVFEYNGEYYVKMYDNTKLHIVLEKYNKLRPEQKAEILAKKGFATSKTNVTDEKGNIIKKGLEDISKEYFQDYYKKMKDDIAKTGKITYEVGGKKYEIDVSDNSPSAKQETTLYLAKDGTWVKAGNKSKAIQLDLNGKPIMRTVALKKRSPKLLEKLYEKRFVAGVNKLREDICIEAASKMVSRKNFFSSILESLQENLSITTKGMKLEKFLKAIEKDKNSRSVFSNSGIFKNKTIDAIDENGNVIIDPVTGIPKKIMLDERPIDALLQLLATKS